MLPQLIADELFDLRHRPSDQAIDHLCDELHKFRLTVTHVDNYDLVIVINFTLPRGIGEIRLDRLTRMFEITAVNDNYTYLPRKGDWPMVEQCLSQLNDGNRY